MHPYFRRAAAAALLTLSAACVGEDTTAPVVEDPAKLTYAAALNVRIADMTRTSTGLYYLDVAQGTGPVVAAGDRIAVQYTGWLANGTMFDTSRDDGVAYPFRLGRSEVIAGWDEGLVGMRVGGRRRLVIPPSLGYGSTGNGPIPPNAVMVFDVEIVNRF
jgi:FKBP-type peptidyl-prolyl cis-trans isomerase